MKIKMTKWLTMILIMENKTRTRLNPWRVGVRKGGTQGFRGDLTLTVTEAVRTLPLRTPTLPWSGHVGVSFFVQKACFLYKKDLFTMQKKGVIYFLNYAAAFRYFGASKI